ncbi:MAG TPA: hypothetical protein VGR08_05350 [Thermomicrobiales bacterium]|nr:hypothetical protein [Thermomicrobiales bacterium]
MTDDSIRQKLWDVPKAQHGRFDARTTWLVLPSGNGQEGRAAHWVPERWEGGYLLVKTVPSAVRGKGNAGIAPDQSDAGRPSTVEH